MSSQQRTAGPAQKSGKGKVLFSEAGCDVCGAHQSSSFRSCPDTGARLCNSCHCKSYRLKRKLGGLLGNGALQHQHQQRRARVASEPLLHPVPPELAPLATTSANASAKLDTAAAGLTAWGPAALYGAPQAVAAAVCAGVLPPAEQVPEFVGACAASAASPSPTLAALQQRVFLETCGDGASSGGSGAGELTMMLHCARRAQQATPACAQRSVLGLLPRLSLCLPDDPPGLLHTISCLVEAVVPASAPAEQAADSDEAATTTPGSAAAAAAAPPTDAPTPAPASAAAASEPPSIRLTLFASAGAVACWYEAPPEAPVALGFSPATRTPIWSTRLPGFTLHFPHAYCPQMDLFAAIHQHVVSLGQAALQHPTLDLDCLSVGGAGGSQGQALQQQLPASAGAPQQQQQQQQGSQQYAPPPSTPACPPDVAQRLLVGGSADLAAAHEPRVQPPRQPVAQAQKAEQRQEQQQQQCSDPQQGGLLPAVQLYQVPQLRACQLEAPLLQEQQQQQQDGAEPQEGSLLQPLQPCQAPRSVYQLSFGRMPSGPLFSSGAFSFGDFLGSPDPGLSLLEL